MKMPYFYSLSIFILVLVTSLMTTGCNKKPEVQQTEEIRQVKTLLIEALDTSNIRQFPGRIDANRKAELAFRVAGKVQELLVKEGDLVAQGDIIAKLDPTDFQIAVDDKKALFNRSEKDYLRGKDLVKDGNISKMDFDRLESNFLSARADLKLTQQQLDYTELKAPFDGTVARRYIQTFEEIQAKQNIITLNDNNILEVKFDIPENLILGLQQIEKVDSVEESNMKDQIPVVATFQSDTEKKYSLKFKELSTKADANTQTFSATYTMPKPDNVIILPGMTTTVILDLSQFMANNVNLFYLPVSAVVADVNLQGSVWIVDEETMTVDSVAVKVGSMKGQQIQVTEGIKIGQRVVTAGVPFLYKGLKVSLLKNVEQAKDNIKHDRPVMDKTLNSPSHTSTSSSANKE